MIIARCSIALLAISAGLLPASANRRMGRRHLQDGEPIETNVTDIVGIADVIEEDGKSGVSDDDDKETVNDFVFYQYVDAETILSNLYGEDPESRGITFLEALRYDGLSKCYLTPIRDDFELLQVQTVLEVASNSDQATDFAWVGVAKDPVLVYESPQGDMPKKKFLCRAGSWKNLYDDSDLGGYDTAPCGDPGQCPGGCWLENVMENKNGIFLDYWGSGEPDNAAGPYNQLQTKALMQASTSRLFDAHEGQINQAKGAIYLCKLK